jgi:hypothetical protein
VTKTQIEREFVNAFRAVLGKGPLPYSHERAKTRRPKGVSVSHHLDGYFGDGNRHVSHRRNPERV